MRLPTNNINNHHSPYSDDGFVAIFPISYWHGLFEISVSDSQLFGCHFLDKYTIEPRLIPSDNTPIRIVKNVFNLTHIFSSPGKIIVSETIKSLLPSTISCHFRNIHIERAFYYPFGPCALPSPTTQISDESAAEMFQRLADQYLCPPPNDRYYELSVHSSYLLGPSFSDTSVVKLGVNAPQGSSIYSREVTISRQMITQHGIVFDRCYMVRRDVFDILNPYLFRPFFWALHYSFPLD